MTPRRERRGFTLIELSLALSLVGMAMAGGIVLMDHLGDSASRIVADGRVASREGNGARILRRTLLDATWTTDTTKRLIGDERSVEFESLCDSSAGWKEPCRFSIAIDYRGDSSAVVAVTQTLQSIVLRRQIGAAEFRYFDATRADSGWTRHWSSNVTLPVALAIVTDRDTAIFPLGAPRD